MKRLLKIMFACAMALTVVACHQEDPLAEQPIAPEAQGDMISIRFGAVIPDEIKVDTRAVDPDGRGIQNMSLFCFNGEGLLISVESASVPASVTGQTAGTFDAKIPNNTRIIHFLANQNVSRFDVNAQVGKSEDQIASVLEGSSGMMIYWARVEIPAAYQSGDQIKNWIATQTTPASMGGEGKPIVMLRNQARVTVVSRGADSSLEKQWEGSNFIVTGFNVCNTQAFGTVAPFHPTYGFPTYQSSDYTPEYGVANGSGSRSSWVVEKNVTLPERKDKLSDIADVDTAVETFIFETENSSADPVTVIIRGKNVVDGVAQAEMYYHVTLTDGDGEQVLVRRNHHYEINVVGNLKYGAATFAEALNAPATNNIWLSISDEVKSVQDASFKLSVKETDVVLDADKVALLPSLTLTFNVESLGSENIDMNDVSVSWVENNQDVSATYNDRLVPSTNNSTAMNFAIASGGKSAVGTIDLTLNQMPQDKNILRGTLLVKYGRLQRKITVLTVRRQSFTPAWVSTEVYGSLSNVNARENIEVVFTIPETCPEELFPMDVLISANKMDIRSAAGQVLPIVRKGEEGYGESFSVDVDGDGNPDTSDFGYKYVFTVTEPGVQRVYFENILHAESGDREYVTLEAAHFERMTKIVTFSELNKAITIPSMPRYSYVAPGSSVAAETISYMLVPQKRFAPVHFDLEIVNEATTPASAVAVDSDDEFLLYSSNLDHYLTHTDHAFETTFVPFDKSKWSTGGRVYGFYLNADDNDGKFTLHMMTSKAKSAEPVRIASNVTGAGSNSIKNSSVPYNGQMFRSKVFELANYSPYRFAARVNGLGVDAVNDSSIIDTPAEPVDDIEFTYVPNQSVEIAFDVTSFKANDGSSVDPFGSGFEIYIDAEMLELDEAAHAELLSAQVAIYDKQVDAGGNITMVSNNKPKLEKLSDGRYVYRVDGDRATEAGFFTTAALGGEKVAKERKVLKFKTKEAVSSGKITISSNEEHVVYHSKTFNVINTPISGNITYGVDASSQSAVAANQFISFARKADGSRIGSITVTAAGKYELRLRKEYDFDWAGDDPVELYTSIGGEYYMAEFANVKALFDAPEVKLIKQ